MALIGAHFILIILGLDLIQAEHFIQGEHFLVETEKGTGWDKLLDTSVSTDKDLKKVKNITHHLLICSSAHLRIFSIIISNSNNLNKF